jgi:glycosyltransferase involved in cell wall biosynthesis
MDVLHLVTNRPPFFRNRADTLRARGHECTVVNVPGLEMDDREQRKERTRSPLHYARFYGRVLSAARGSYDVVHAHYGLTAPFALAQPRRPVVLTLWGSDLMGDFGWLSERCAARADEVVVMSREMADRLDRDVTVIPHGVDADLFRPMDRTAARRDVGWGSDAFHVLFPYAPIREVKNHPLARRVVERVDDVVDRPVELHTVYDADVEQVPVYMNAADALLLTSHREGSPNTVKEAMACNLPVVATDVGDVGEQLDGVHPSVVGSDEDALVEGLAAVLASGERSDGRAAALELDLDSMAERLETVYRRAVESRAGGRTSLDVVGRISSHRR